MTRLAIKVLLLGVVSGLAGVAAASPVSGDIPTLVVRYNAELLATDSGARALYHRLAQAAEQVCPAPVNTHLPNEMIVKCRREAVAAAVGKIHNQRLAAVYAAATSKSG